MPGKWFDEYREGDTITHPRTVVVTMEDNVAFCRLTRNEQPLHLDAQAARDAGFRDVLVNGLYTLAVSVGLTVPETTEGTLVGNLGYDDVRHPAPVHPGDRLEVQTRVVSVRASSKPGRGIVQLEHTVTQQEGRVVCSYRRTALVRSKEGS